MIGKMARWALIGEMFIYSCWAMWLHGASYAPLRIAAMVLGMALLLRFIVTLGPFLTVLALRLRDHRPVFGVGFGRALLGEFIAKSLSFTLWQPFEHWLMRPDVDPRQAQDVPILLVHGYLCNRGSWFVMRRLLGARLPNPVFTLSLEPPFSRIDDYVSQLDARVNKILDSSGHATLHLVCHSMGGLVARAWLLRNQGWGRVASLTMLGSPHHGTELARAGIGQNVRQLVKGNAWLAALAAQETGLLPPAPVMSIRTENDNLVYPPESADLTWAANIRIEGVGHVQMQSSTVAADMIAANIVAASPDAARQSLRER